MPGTQTELTSRLEVSRRQFFQWHLVEKRQIPEVKAKMDELTRFLRLAGYNYNFIAEEKSWKSRSRHWNTSGKAAWKVGLHEKGRGLPMRKELSNVPIWIEWDQDVGDWGKANSDESHLSHSSVAQTEERQEPSQNTGHCDGQTQNSTSTQTRDGFDSSHALPESSPSVPGYPHTLHPTQEISTTPDSLNTGQMAWSQRNAAPFTSIHPPLISLPQQTPPTQHQHMNGSNIWYPNYPTATTAPTTASMRLPDTAHGTDNNFAPYRELSHMTPQTRFTSVSGSNIQNYAYQGQNGYQNGYAPPPSPSRVGSHHPQQSAELSVTHSTQPQGPRWTGNQWDSAQYGSGSP